MKIVVAGAAGNIGSHLTPLLVDRGHDVTAIVHSRGQRHKLKDLEISIVEADVMEPSSIAGITKGADVVFQLIGYLFAPKRGLVETNNLRASKNVADECLKSGVSRIIYSSSPLVYGPKADLPSREDHATYPNTAYSRGKKSVEDYLFSKVEKGLIPTVMRVGHVYGPGVSAIEEFKTMISRGVFSLAGSGDHLIPPIQVTDLAMAMALAAEKERAAGQIYNVNDDQPITLKEFSNLLASHLGKGDVKSLPVWLFRGAGSLFELISLFTKRRPFFDRDTVKLMTMAHWGANTKLKKELGWKPTYPTFYEGVDTCFV